MQKPFFQKTYGYVYPTILMATLAVGLFIVTLTQLQKSNRTQFSHLDEYQQSFNIAYSALVELQASLKKQQWENRSFKGKPVTYTQDLFGGTFNLMAEDFDPDNFIFNVKIRTRIDKKYQMFYWRLRYVPDLLDFTRLTIPLYFSHFPATGKSKDFTDFDLKVNSELKKCQDNWPKAKEIAKILGDKDDYRKIIDGLGIPVDSEVPDNTQTRITPEQFTPTPIQLEPADLFDTVQKSPGIVKPSIDKIVAELPLNDIYPPPTDLKKILTIPVSRFEIVVYIVRLLEIPEVNDQAAVENFADIDHSSESIQNIFNTAVSSAFTFNLVQGWEGSFYGEQVMRREHMAILLENIDGYISLALPEIQDQNLYNKYLKIQSWVNTKKVEFEEVNPTSGLTIGDGIEMLTALE